MLIVTALLGAVAGHAFVRAGMGSEETASATDRPAAAKPRATLKRRAHRRVVRTTTAPKTTTTPAPAPAPVAAPAPAPVAAKRPAKKAAKKRHAPKPAKHHAVKPAAVDDGGAEPFVAPEAAAE